jgi:hypothetical protein
MPARRARYLDRMARPFEGENSRNVDELVSPPVVVARVGGFDEKVEHFPEPASRTDDEDPWQVTAIREMVQQVDRHRPFIERDHDMGLARGPPPAIRIAGTDWKVERISHPLGADWRGRSRVMSGDCK